MVVWVTARELGWSFLVKAVYYSAQTLARVRKDLHGVDFQITGYASQLQGGALSLISPYP